MTSRTSLLAVGLAAALARPAGAAPSPAPQASLVLQASQAPLEDLLTAVLRRDHASYVALQELEARVVAREDAGETASGADLLLLAGGFLAGDGRALREYLRLTGEAPPRGVRARMTPDLARLLATASDENVREGAWTTLVPRLEGTWRRPAGVRCLLHANGVRLGDLATVRPRVVPEAPQRLHVTCDDGFGAVARAVPVAASAPVDVPLGPAHGRVVTWGRGDGAGTAGGGTADPFAATAGTMRDEGSTAPTLNRGRLGLVTSVFALGERRGRRLPRPHNLGLVDGVFARGGLRWASSQWAAGLAFARVSTPPPEPRSSSSRATRRADAWSADAAWRPRLHPRLVAPVELGLWRWRCAERPCGFGTRDPGVTLGAGLAATLVDSGIAVEISAVPGIVAGETPAPFLDLKAIVSHEW